MSKVKTITIDLVFLRMALVPRIYLDSACCCYWYFSFSVPYVLLKSCHICFGVYPYSDALKKWGENTKRSRVFLPTLSCCGCFLRALQQNRAQTRLLYLFHIKLRLPSKSVGVYWTCIGSQVNFQLQTRVWTIVAANKRKRNEITRIRIEGWKPICSLQWKWSSSMQ